MKFLHILLIVTCLSLSFLAVDRSQASSKEAKKSRSPIKYVFTADYPLGKKDKYIAWINSVAKDLMAPSELRGLASYDNYFSGSPNRLIEFEFDSMEDAAKYFKRKKVHAVFKSWTNYGVNVKYHILELRSDYKSK